MLRKFGLPVLIAGLLALTGGSVATQQGHHAVEELGTLQQRLHQLRGAYDEAGHGVDLAADRARRGLLLRDGAGELHDRRGGPCDTQSTT